MRPGFPSGSVPTQETEVQSLAREVPTCLRASNPVHHSCWACAPEPRSHSHWAHVQQLLKPKCPRAPALQQEKPPQWEAHTLQRRAAPAHRSWRKAQPAMKSRHSQKEKKKKKFLRVLRGQDPNSFQLPLFHLGFHQKCPDPNCRVKKSLHGHHPRDCLFYLRDWSAVRLQKLLQVRWPTWLVCQLPRRGGRV